MSLFRFFLSILCQPLVVLDRECDSILIAALVILNNPKK